MADQNFPPLLDLPPAPPPSREPGRPSIRDLLDQDKRAVEDALTNPKKGMDPKRLDDLRDFYQRFTPPVPGVFLSQPIQVAALPEALAQILSVAPEEQAVQAARAVNAPPESFDSFLESVPLEQARDLQRSYLDQQNLAAAIAAMQKNVDDFAAAQIEAERAAMEEQDQIAAMNDLASAFGIGMEGPTPDMGRAGMVAAWGNPADEFAESVFGGEEETAPSQMSTPFGVAMGMLGQNVEANPLSGQFGPMSQHQMASFDEDDPFGDDPFSTAEPAFSVAPAVAALEPGRVASFAAPQMAQQVVADVPPSDARRGETRDMLSPWAANQLLSSWQNQQLMDETQQALNDARDAREAAARTITDMESLIGEMEQEDPLSSPLDDAYSALNQAQVEALAPSALQSAIASQSAFGVDPFSGLTSDDFGVSENDPTSADVGAVANSPAMGAASLSAMNAAFGDDPFSGALGLDSLGFSADDSISTADISAAMSGTDTGASDDSDTSPGALSSLGLSDMTISDADISGIGADTGMDSGAADVSAGTSPGDGGPTGSSGSDGTGAGDSFGPSDMGWRSGGRVKGKGLNAARGKSRSKSRGLAAMRC